MSKGRLYSKFQQVAARVEVHLHHLCYFSLRISPGYSVMCRLPCQAICNCLWFCLFVFTGNPQKGNTHVNQNFLDFWEKKEKKKEGQQKNPKICGNQDLPSKICVQWTVFPQRKFWQKAFDEPTGKQKLPLLAEIQLGHTGDSKKPSSTSWELKARHIWL